MQVRQLRMAVGDRRVPVCVRVLDCRVKARVNVDVVPVVVAMASSGWDQRKSAGDAGAGDRARTGGIQLGKLALYH